MHISQQLWLLLTLLAGAALLVISGGLTRAQRTGTTTRVSVASDGTQGNERSFESSISADGRYVAFYSDASNLVPGDNIRGVKTCMKKAT
jgi:hypothetical protein